MLCNRITYLNSSLLNVCFFHTTQYNSAIGNVMKKILTGSKKRRRLYMQDPILPTSSSFTKELFRKPTRENTRRLAVLNKLFMTHITDLMATGENATEFAGYGLEINRVKVTPDYQGLNVYWIAKEAVDYEELEKLLHGKSGALRHELTQMHLIGMVPKIKFIKDEEYARIVEVESRLAYADFGEDYEVPDTTLKYRKHLELSKSLDPKLKQQILALEAREETCKIDIGEDIPEMPQNVLGLNHFEITERIRKSMKKSQALHRNQPMMSVEEEGHAFNPNPIEFKSAKAEREAFQKFLSERQILRNRMWKAQKNLRPEADYMEEESERMTRLRLESIGIDELEDRDFIEEDYEVDRNVEEKK